MSDPTEYEPNSRDITDDPNFLAPRCGVCGVPWTDHMGIMGVCLWNKALKEDLKDSLEAHDEMRLEIVRLTKERDEARRWICHAGDLSLKFAKQLALLRGWDCFKEEEMACDTLSQEVSQEGSKLPTTISSNGICITEYIPPQNSVREIPPYGAYTTGECTLSVHTIKKTQ